METRSRSRDVEDGEGTSLFRRLEVWPRLDGGGEPLEEAGNLRRRDASLQREVKSREVDIDRLVRMGAACVLDRVGVHRELVDLSEEHGVPVLGGEDLEVDGPALRRSVVVAVVRLPAGGQLESAAGTAGHVG
jgi:hypothetical protein